MNNLGVIKQIKLQRAITHSDIDEFKLDEKYFYDKESQELYEIGLQRQINVKGLDKIFLRTFSPASLLFPYIFMGFTSSVSR